MINRVQGVGAVGPQQSQKAQNAPSKASFGQMLEQVRQEKSGINFSKHAMSRAEEKGAKNILAFNATQAFIINVPYGRVITTMNQDEMKENVFTNIDGAVLL